METLPWWVQLPIVAGVIGAVVWLLQRNTEQLKTMVAIAKSLQPAQPKNDRFAELTKAQRELARNVATLNERMAVVTVRLDRVELRVSRRMRRASRVMPAETEASASSDSDPP